MTSNSEAKYPQSDTTSASRATQDAIIVSFVAILCSYYWVTVIWPMIQRRREIYAEKLITMEKLLRKQQTTGIENSESEEYEGIREYESPKDASFRKSMARFNLKSTIKLNPVENISENDVIEEVLSPTKGKYVPDQSEHSSSVTDHGLHAHAGKDVEEDFVSAPHPDDVIIAELGDVENHDKARSSVSNATRIVLPIRDLKPAIEATNSAESSNDDKSTVLESSTKVTTDHRVLWSHISRTTSNISYSSYNDTDSNPWSHTSSAASSSNPEGFTAVRSDPQDGTLTYSEARELRIQQDAEYSLSLAAASEEKSKLERLAEREVRRILKL